MTLLSIPVPSAAHLPWGLWGLGEGCREELLAAFGEHLGVEGSGVPLWVSLPLALSPASGWVFAIAST